MATNDTPRTTAPASASVTEMMKKKTDALHAAIEQHIVDIPGIKLHSVRFSVDPSVATDPCGGKCKPGQVCLLSSSGEFVCA
jgi:hypothetical protein